MKKILITSIGSLVGQNIFETLDKRDRDFKIIGTNSIANAPVYEIDKTYLVSETNMDSSHFTKELSDIIKKEMPDLIIPGRDIDVIILSQLKKDFADTNCCFLTGESHLAELMEQKMMSYEFAVKESLPFVETVVCDMESNKKAIDQFVEKYGFPLLLKPVKGFASRGVSIVLNYDQLKRLSSPVMVLQEYLGDVDEINKFKKIIENGSLPLFYSLEENKYSFQIFIDSSGNLKGKFATIHDMKKGASVSVEPNNNEASDKIMDQFFNAFKKNGWFGPLNIQMQKSSITGDLKAYEFNGRFTGATAARYFLGYDEIGFALEEVGIKLEKDTRFNSQKKITKKHVVSIIPEKKEKTLKDHFQILNMEY